MRYLLLASAAFSSLLLASAWLSPGHTATAQDDVTPTLPYYFPLIFKDFSSAPSGDKPDLRISNLDILEGEPIVGSEIEIRIQIINWGGQPATGFVLSWRPEGEGSGTSIEKTIDRLDPGESQDFQPFTTYTYEEKGTYDSFSKVDCTDVVTETDESNNTRTLEIKVKEP